MTLEEKLNALQFTSNIDMSESHLLCYKASIQATARSKDCSDICTYYSLTLIGELNIEFAAQDDKELYFRLWKQLGIASTLTEFSASTNSVDSIILGTYTVCIHVQ